MATGKFVSYLRVSTAKQGHSGLGLEAQRQSVTNYLNGGRHKLLKEFIEIKSGKNDQRPELAKALHMAKVTGAKLLIAKLDRLSRDAAFLLNLQKSKVDFVACDMPEADEAMIGVMAVIAQRERKMISQRTKDALAAARQNPAWRKKHPKGLGNPNGARALRKAARGNSAAVNAIKEKAGDFAKDIAPVIEDIRAEGIITLAAIAEELNARTITTARGGEWHASTVRNIMQRMES